MRIAARRPTDDDERPERLRPAARHGAAGLARAWRAEPIATSPEAAQAAAADGQAAILVRAETSPDDVHGMAAAAGILTSRGGLASHAAVVARGWGIPAVVGATGMAVSADRVVIGDRILRPGDVITIDGRTGEVFEGVIPGTTEVVPEARTLLAWATELGIDVGREAAANRRTRACAAAARKATPDDMCLRVIAIKGLALHPGHRRRGPRATRRRRARSSTSSAIDGLVCDRRRRPEADRDGAQRAAHCSTPTGRRGGPPRPTPRSRPSSSSTTG